MSLVRDVLMCEPLRRNRALNADAYLALVECAGSRPSSAGAANYDHEDPLSFF